jgi:1-deoxy-D-xylulose-5-phosphate synthase
MPGGTGVDKFMEKFPERGLDVGMTEEHAVTFASGLALGGMKPVVAIYSTFMQRAYDQIIHDVCQVKNGLPVVFALDRGGLVGEDGATHQGVFDLSYLRHIPHMTVMAPKDEAELRLMLATCLSLDGPSAVRYPRGNGIGVALDAPLEPLPVGKGEMLRDPDGALELGVIAIGHSVQTALEAADVLLDEGRNVAVMNARFVKPLDREMICDLARRARRLVTVEENVVQGGFGSAILELLQSEGLHDVPVTIVGVPDEFIHHGAQKLQRRDLGLDKDGLLYTMRRALPAKRRKTASRETTS